METTHLVTEFITHTGANTKDAVSCLKSWEWDLKKALIDYNDTSTTEYFNNKKNESDVVMKAKSSSTSSPNSHGTEGQIVSLPLVQSASPGQMHPSFNSVCSVALCSDHHQKQQLVHPAYQHMNNGGVGKKDIFGGSNSSSNSSTSSATLHVHTPRAKVFPRGLESTANAYSHHQYQHCSNATDSALMVGIENPTCFSSGKKLERGISRATENVTLVSRARQEFEMDFHAHINEQNDKNLNFIDTPDYTFTLPDLTKYRDDFRKFLEKDLIENSTLNSLEATNRLNWWYESGACRKLWPLATTGDGNCLLHAASLAMWGFHDRRLTLRRTLHDILSKQDFREALYRRWRFQQTRVNKQAGFVFCESEWAKEWDEIVAIASPEPRRNSKNAGTSRRRSLLIEKSFDAVASGATSSCADGENATYESLEEIHVLTLAHILRRTIIVVSDVFLRDINGEAFSPIPFGGVYLPFEVPSNECHRAPLLLAYDMAHFSALVAMEAPNVSPPALIPLVDATNQLLPIQFCIDPGKDFNWHEYDGSDGNWTLTDREHIALLKEYLDIVHASGIESPDHEIYCDDSDDEYEKKISDGEIGFADENYNNNITGPTDMSITISTTPSLLTTNATTTIATVPSAPVVSTVSSMTTSNQSIGASNSKDAGSKSKAAKQLQSVAKQFGSIGKSMSRKLRKNIGSITRIGSKHGGLAGNMGVTSKKNEAHDKNSFRGEYPRFRIICAQLNSRRHEYQEEMIKNYLESAQERFLEAERVRDRKEMEGRKYVTQAGHEQHNHEYDDVECDVSLIDHPEADGSELVNCINGGCLHYGTAATSYMCLECYEMQCKRESNCNSNSGQSNPFLTENTLRYGTGKSKFYAEADMEAHDRIQRLPSARRLTDLDQTLYLSRSTFYNDTKLEDIHGGGASKHVPLSISVEQPLPSSAHSSQNSHPQSHHHHNFYHGEGGRIDDGNYLTKYRQQFNQQRTPIPNTQVSCIAAKDYTNSAKPPIGSSLASSCNGGVASIYLFGGSTNVGTASGNISNKSDNEPFHRATAMCVVNLPRVSGSTDDSGNKGARLVSIDTGATQTCGLSGEASKSLHQPFSSSSSSSSLGGNNGLQLSSATVNSSHCGKNQLCRTEGCKFYGSINTNFYCSKCCQEYNI
uniref:ubiquitinyl hydrolase 1 n=1 Tax=Anopheles atroparvus TaxID=41427 RepID=A0AAG5D211_ANOAO